MHTCLKCDREFTSQTGLTIHLNHCKGKVYCNNPKCKKQLVDRQTKFCSTVCAALVNSPGRKQTEETRKKISITLGGTGDLKHLGNGKCINCSNETTNPKYCSSQCLADYKYNESVKRWLAGEISGTVKGGCAGFIRKYLFKKYNNKCSQCGWGKFNPYTKSEFPALETEHIDGHSDNNDPSNVTLLCPNCQALTPTYKGANKGNGRRSYMKNYYIKDESGKILRGS
ncbi:hypothetical protein KAR91_73135 [Candidatus Pacearchaeota archaeon]|nr:hypothetical protein [Candidatus Pacearchaeota archaeon]